MKRIASGDRIRRMGIIGDHSAAAEAVENGHAPPPPLALPPGQLTFQAAQPPVLHLQAGRQTSVPAAHQAVAGHHIPQPGGIHSWEGGEAAVHPAPYSASRDIPARGFSLLSQKGRGFVEQIERRPARMLQEIGQGTTESPAVVQPFKRVFNPG